MDIRPTGPESKQDVRQHVRQDPKASSKPKIRTDNMHGHAPRSRAPELSAYLKRNESLQEVRSDLVELAKQRLASGEYMQRSTAEETAAAILKSS